MISKCLGGLTLCFWLTAQAQDKKETAQVCAWMIETNKPDDVHRLDLGLQSERELEFLYVIGGEGIVTPTSKLHSPSSGTYVLHAGKAAEPWGFGGTVDTPAKIDITIELRQMPADIFSKAETPLLAKFSFRRDIPESEKSAPPTLAKKQCAAVKK
jgi:hypothetical protein